MADSWDTIADWYASHLRAGSAMHDFARDMLLDCLPGDLEGQRVLDLGCGEELLARAVAERGASVVGIDPSPRMIGHAQAAEDVRSTGVVYAVDDGCVLDGDEDRAGQAGVSLVAGLQGRQHAPAVGDWPSSAPRTRSPRSAPNATVMAGN